MDLAPHRLRLDGHRYGFVGPATGQIGHSGADRDAADAVFTGRRGDFSAVTIGLPGHPVTPG